MVVVGGGEFQVCPKVNFCFRSAQLNRTLGVSKTAVVPWATTAVISNIMVSCLSLKDSWTSADTRHSSRSTPYFFGIRRRRTSRGLGTCSIVATKVNQSAGISYYLVVACLHHANRHTRFLPGYWSVSSLHSMLCEHSHVLGAKVQHDLGSRKQADHPPRRACYHPGTRHSNAMKGCAH